MTNDLRCWCGRRTTVYVSSDRDRERSITDTGKVETRICPEHGEWWREDPALTVAQEP